MSPSVAGALYAIAAYAAWGLVPVYWKALRVVPATAIVAHRVIWSVLFVAALLTARRKWPDVVAVLRDRSRMTRLVASTTLISANWGLFIWAVNAGRILQTSLGYFVNPILSVLLGVIFLGERMRPLQWVSVALASAGVLLLLVLAGVFPWVSLSLAVTFGLYGLIRKTTAVDGLTGLFVETLLTVPFALGYLLLAPGVRASTSFGDAFAVPLVLASGAITALPLVWFAEATRRLPLSILGFFQYLSPSLTFLLAVLVYDEPLDRPRLFTFGCIWSAAILFSFDARRGARERERAVAG